MKRELWKALGCLISICITLTALLLAGCGGDESHSTPLTVATAALPGGTVGTAYSQTLVASGGTAPYLWSVSAGALPTGLSLNASTGVISGTPTTSGTASFTVRVTDSANPAGTATQALSITVVAVTPLAVTTTSLPGATVGTAYSMTLAATGGTTPYTWSVSVGALPAGLSLNASTGVISGTPTTAAISTFTVQVTDSGARTATMALSITVSAASAPLTVTTASLAGATVGTPYSQTLAATGGTPPYSWSVTVGALPAGLSLNATTGVISGSPTAAGTSSFTVTVTDSAAVAGTATKALSITVSAAGTALVVATATLPVEVLGTAYSQTLAATGGTAPYTWSISAGALPPGLSLAASTGIISGTPLTAATGNFTVRVTDSATTAATATGALSITSSTAAGLAAFNTNCSGCHGTLTAGVGVSGSPIVFPSSITAVNNAIAANTGGMSFLSGLGAATLSAIAGVLH
jgi:large repetitive protein